MLHTRTAPPGVRSAVALATAFLLVPLGAGVASAHAAVTSPDATPGAELALPASADSMLISMTPAVGSTGRRGSQRRPADLRREHPGHR